MELATKKKLLIQQLSNYYNGDSAKVQQLANECKALGFPLGDEKNIDSIAEKPEAFFSLMTFSDFGILAKIGESLKTLTK